jgi:ElaB/YqjD/DUF883 family membrane-anchored ribosome-binding protein
MAREQNTMQSGEQGTAEKLRDTAHDVKENVRALGTQMRDVATEKYDQIRDQASEYYRQGKLRAQAIEEDMIDFVREKPVKAVLIAAGVGLLLGVFLRRR